MGYYLRRVGSKEIISYLKSNPRTADLMKNIQVEHVIRNNKRTIKVDKSATVKDCIVSCFRNNDTLVYVDLLT